MRILLAAFVLMVWLAVCAIIIEGMSNLDSSRLHSVDITTVR